MNETLPNPEEVSKTAKLTAFLRTFSDIPYSQEIAQLTHSQDALVQMDGEATIKFAPIIEARFKRINEIIRGLGVKNILELSCGFSPRGLILTQDPRVTYVGTDLPSLLHEQENIISQMLSESEQQRPNLHYQETNVFDPEQLFSASGTLPSPIAIVSEGLFQYLEREKKLAVAKNIKQVLIARDGLWVTVDFLTQIAQAEMMQKPANQEFVESLSASTGTDIKSNAFADDDDIARFIDEAGFDAEEFDLSTMIGQLSSIEKSGADPEQILAILQMRKVCILRPRQKA